MLCTVSTAKIKFTFDARPAVSCKFVFLKLVLVMADFAETFDLGAMVETRAPEAMEGVSRTPQTCHMLDNHLDVQQAQPKQLHVEMHKAVNRKSRIYVRQ